MDETTLATSRGKFARVCVEIDLNKPLEASYKMRGVEGLQELCFNCGRYGHKEVKCPLSSAKEGANNEGTGGATATNAGSD